MARLYFILPVGGGSGGAHSVVQEATAMRELGVDASILVNERNFLTFTRTYNRFEIVKTSCFPFTGPKDLAERLSDADIVIATTNTSVYSLAESMMHGKHNFRTGYYVQDYEPLFAEVGSEAWNIALGSFTKLKTCAYFAKTRWLRDIVFAMHGHEVSVVTPSIDHSIYRPAAFRAQTKRRTLVAMVRPPTPRRAPNRTMRTLGRLAAEFGSTMDFVAFGTTTAEMASHGIPQYEGVSVAGILSQGEVAALLQQSDFFLDLSDYQAFGRTAAEAMACGTVTLAPSLGGSREFIHHGVNSFLTDTANESDTYETIRRIIGVTDDEIRHIRIAAIEAVSIYTPLAAAASEMRALGLII